MTPARRQELGALMTALAFRVLGLERLTALAEKMAEFGVGMAFHHHMGTIVETDLEVDRLMAATGKAVGLLFDCGHSIFSGGHPIALLRRHVARVRDRFAAASAGGAPSPWAGLLPGQR